MYVFLIRSIFLLPALLCSSPEKVENSAPINGDAVIRGQLGGKKIEITTTSRLAGAIHSLKWNNKEFIDSLDHGRQLQSACSFDVNEKGEFWAERFNPTEAGSRADGTGATTTSKLLSLNVTENGLSTSTQMAFWLAPGEKSVGRLALNQQRLSQHRLSKRVQIATGDLDHVISYDVTFHVPEGEKHTYGQFEALTGYMPEEFSQFWSLDPQTGKLFHLDDGPGEQQFPVVFANKAGTHAMGIFSPDQPSTGFSHAGYGRFRFPVEKVVKWNCVFRERHPIAIPSGDYHYKMFVAVGDLAAVSKTLHILIKRQELK